MVFYFINDLVIMEARNSFPFMTKGGRINE